MRWGGGRAGIWRGVFLTLAMFALAVKVLVPPGFMVADNGSSIPLVICTGHGPLVVGGQGDSKAPAHKTSDAPCAFAGSAAPPTPATAAVIAEPHTIVTAPIELRRTADLAPGRGLAAPPPQSHAPPVFPKTI